MMKTMMKRKSRKKASRHRGSHTHGRGFKKKARGKGHRGGVGMSGTGKRSDQKKTKVLRKDKKYFGKVIPLGMKKVKKPDAVSLESIDNNIQRYVKSGKAKESSGVYEINLGKHKIIGNKTALKLKIVALAASKHALEAVKKAGGEIVLPEVKKVVKKEESE